MVVVSCAFTPYIILIGFYQIKMWLTLLSYTDRPPSLPKV
jgi:hypothetical protein